MRGSLRGEGCMGTGGITQSISQGKAGPIDAVLTKAIGTCGK